MSIRSIVEFNHDMAHDIERDPEAFMAALSQYLASANARAAEELERFGVRVAWSGHHSSERKVVTKFSTMPL